MLYSVEEGLLEIRESSYGQLVWRGTFDEGKVFRAVALPGTEDCVVIVEHPAGWHGSNIMRIKSDGTLAWRAASDFEPYVDIAIQEGRLLAWSWSGYMLSIDPQLGSIIESTFVK